MDEAAKEKAKMAQEAKKRVFNSPMARKIFNELFGDPYEGAPEELRRCQKFLPGRMLYSFDTDFNNDRYVPTPVHMSREDAPHLARTHSNRIPSKLMAKLR